MFEFFIRRVHDHPSNGIVVHPSNGIVVHPSNGIVVHPSGSNQALDFISFIQNYKTSSMYN